MNRRLKLILAAGIGLAAIVGGTGVAYAMMQADNSAQLRATGKVGEQADGYLGIVGAADAGLRSQVDAVNIKRRAYYTDLAAKRNAKIEEVAAATACQLFSTKVQPGQYYRLPDGVWRQREAGQTISLPSYCA
jgi:uncharacterized protein YdbL (DUF1318 family)